MAPEGSAAEERIFRAPDESKWDIFRYSTAISPILNAGVEGSAERMVPCF
jgi:hypothetical protein